MQQSAKAREFISKMPNIEKIQKQDEEKNQEQYRKYIMRQNEILK